MVPSNLILITFSRVTFSPTHTHWMKSGSDKNEPVPMSLRLGIEGKGAHVFLLVERECNYCTKQKFCVCVREIEVEERGRMGMSEGERVRARAGECEVCASAEAVPRPRPDPSLCAEVNRC